MVHARHLVVVVLATAGINEAAATASRTSDAPHVHVREDPAAPLIQTLEKGQFLQRTAELAASRSLGDIDYIEKLIGWRPEIQRTLENRIVRASSLHAEVARK